ncbi:serine/threonine-protein kinase [Micromonospora sp. CA-246542]|uniref:serine/threonine-protein kinase n=1 Tax=Micromonospora sp. CA-246542 TaxID=3239959 RepID=UPI003D8EBB6D
MTAPQRIGPYAIERLLGVGSFATVWLGYDAVLDTRVAIKVLAENWSHDLRVRERFLDEARLLRRLEHERLIRVHTVGELPDGRPYAVLAWADRGSLRDRLAHGEIPAPTALRLLGEVCAGVAVLHRHGVVHRDLTPGNVLFRSAGPEGAEQVLIADLGLAKALAAASGLTARAGTPGYMAPEQDHPGAVVDTRADVYGLGRLGVRLLAADPTGAHPHRPDPPRPAPQIRLRDGVPPGVAAVLARATAFHPDDRYPDAAALHAALARASDPARRPAGPVAVSARQGPPPRRPRRSLLTGVALVVAVAVSQVAAEPVGTGSGRSAGDSYTTGPLTVALPPGWSATGATWAGQYGADGEPEPALVMSPRPRRWAADPDCPARSSACRPPRRHAPRRPGSWPSVRMGTARPRRPAPPDRRAWSGRWCSMPATRAGRGSSSRPAGTPAGPPWCTCRSSRRWAAGPSSWTPCSPVYGCADPPVGRPCRRARVSGPPR